MIGLEQGVKLGDIWGLGSLFFVLLISLCQLCSKPKEFEKKEVSSGGSDLSRGLSRSRLEIWGKIGGLFSRKGIDQESLEEVEALLYQADLSPETVNELVGKLKEEFVGKDFVPEDFQDFLFQFLKGKMESVQSGLRTSLHTPSEKGEKPQVIMVAGVNGVGKTTTVGKLAHKLTTQGAKVVVGACDTFRAAAVGQLQVWCERSGAIMVKGKEGAASSGVGYDALQRALQEKADYCLLDTAGRLHTKGNLMEELKRCKNVLKKLMPQAPHEILLVLDAITGQNAISQAREFHQTLGLSGIVVTKCDGSAKAGSVMEIVRRLELPILYIGVGEKTEDLNIFKLDEYLRALLVDKA